MSEDQFSYRVFFERTFDPIAPYRVNSGNSPYPGSADKVIFMDVARPMSGDEGAAQGRDRAQLS